MEYLENYYEFSLYEDPAHYIQEDQIGEYVNLLNDFGFKHVFGRDVNKDILIAFLNGIIPDRVIVDLEHIRNEQIPSDPYTKGSIFDLYCETDDGSRIVVELQKKPQGDYIDRAIYYSAFPIQTQIEKGRGKYTFSAVYIINILNFNLKELRSQKEVLSTFRLKELQTNTILSDKYTLIFIELPKFTKKLEDIYPDNILDGFIYCLKHMHSHNSQPQELQQVIWNRLFEAAHVTAMNKQERQAYIQKMTTERDLRNQIAYAKEQAEAEGRAEGLAKGLAEGRAAGLAEGRTAGLAEGEFLAKVEIAKSMKSKGLEITIIAECTKLTIEDIEKL